MCPGAIVVNFIILFSKGGTQDYEEKISQHASLHGNGSNDGNRMWFIYR
jgi:hypothetical protein